MKITVNKDLKENINAFLLILFIFKSSIMLHISKIIGSGIAVWILVLLIISISIITNKLNFRLGFIFTIACISLFFTFNLSLVSYKAEVLYIINQFIANGLITLYLAMQDINYKKFIKYWYILGIINLIIWIYGIYILKYEDLGYMGIGVALTYSFIIFNYYTYNKKYKYLNIMLSIITFALVLIEGNRSSAIICIAYALYNEIISLKGKKIFHILIRLSLIIFLAYSIIFKIQDILILVQDILNNMGIHSYSITKLIMSLDSGIGSSLSGRDTLYNESMRIIYNSNFIPKGIGYFETVTGFVYPHNFILELCITFGVFAIPIIIISICTFFMKVIYIKDKYLLNIIAMLVIFSLIRLSFSGMFWSDIPLWAIIGLLINSNSKKILFKI